MPRIVAISDTHNRHEWPDFPIIPDGDILIHAGDMTVSGTIPEIASFDNWLKTLPHKYKIVIAGNHDWLFMQEPGLAKELINHAIYLQDSECEIEGLKFWGSPWQPEFMNWAFNLPRGEKLARKWAMIPSDIDVLITHGPPEGIRDYLPCGEAVGCADLRHQVLGRIEPKLHIFGHIHYAYGVSDYFNETSGTQFINASICDEAYRPTRQPIVIDL